MTPQKLDVLVVFFAYGGNGGIASEVPQVREWWGRACSQMQSDDRIGRVHAKTLSDTPITMTRNQAARLAHDCGADILVMVDSDMDPDLYRSAGEPEFFPTAFDFCYSRYPHKPTVIGAPYCGPPSHPLHGGSECVYIFDWAGDETDEHTSFGLKMVDRNDAARRKGIHEAAALPTGLIMYTVGPEDSPGNAFSLIDPPYFYYEYTDQYEQQKASTEDVTNTRDIAMQATLRNGENCLFCAWDCWAGHVKPKTVGRPVPITVDDINQKYVRAVQQGIRRDERLLDVDFVGDSRPPVAFAAPHDNTPMNGNGRPVPGPPQEERDRGTAWVRDTLIGHHVVTLLGQETPSIDLSGLTDLVRAVAGESPDRALRIIEVGSWVGESAIAMFNGLGEAGGSIFCVDTWEGSDRLVQVVEDAGGPGEVKAVFDKNVKVAEGAIKWKIGESTHVASTLPPQEADLVYIDAGHDAQSIAGDIEAWLPHVRDGGFIAGHDYGNEHFEGVKEVVDGRFGIDNVATAGKFVWAVRVLRQPAEAA